MTQKIRHKGYFAQVRIYLGKFIRMFVYQNDWKVLPIGAAIAALVTVVVGANMFVTQEGTFNGAFALTCVCIWNGFFNSIQVVCRERSIVKREHRAGLSISAYLTAHMIYQLLLCIAQTAVTMLICFIAGIQFPAQGIITPFGMLDIALTFLLTTYAADMFALMISCIVRNTTAAMTAMPFLLIFQLIFSGALFDLQGFAKRITALSISRWGMESVCAIGRYNEQPMVTLWNTMYQIRDIDYMGTQPVLEAMRQIQREGKMNDFLAWSGQHNQNMAYASDPKELLIKWGALILLLAAAVIVAAIALRFIDRDKR